MTFLCDPKRNTQCRSPLCFEHGGPCGATDRPEFAVRDLLGRPVRLIEKENGGDKPCSNLKTARSSRG
jgi:hypothetical protein